MPTGGSSDVHGMALDAEPALFAVCAGTHGEAWQGLARGHGRPEEVLFLRLVYAEALRVWREGIFGRGARRDGGGGGTVRGRCGLHADERLEARCGWGLEGCEDGSGRGSGDPYRGGAIYAWRVSFLLGVLAHARHSHVVRVHLRSR